MRHVVMFPDARNISAKDWRCNDCRRFMVVSAGIPPMHVHDVVWFNVDFYELVHHS
jgi:hypothetical protein